MNNTLNLSSMQNPLHNPDSHKIGIVTIWMYLVGIYPSPRSNDRRHTKRHTIR